jgi:hypothetical protein
MTQEFGALAAVGEGYALPSEERIARSLNGTMPAHIPTLSVGKIDKVSKARIRYALSELAQGNIENVEHWLHEVAAGIPDPNAPGRWIVMPAPRVAVELFMQLAEFTVPRLKAIALDVTENGGKKRYSMAELQSIVAEQ